SRHCHRLNEKTRSDTYATPTCTSIRHSQTHSQTNSGTTYPKQQSDDGDANTAEAHKNTPRTRQQDESEHTTRSDFLCPERGEMGLNVKPRVVKRTAEQVRILTLDIETRPHTAHVFSLWRQNIGLNQLMERGHVMCFVAKWYDSPE